MGPDLAFNSGTLSPIEENDGIIRRVRQSGCPRLRRLFSLILLAKRARQEAVIERGL